MKSTDFEVGKVYRFIPGRVNRHREADRFKFAGMDETDGPLFWQVAGTPVYGKFKASEVGPELAGTVGFSDAHELMEPCEADAV